MTNKEKLAQIFPDGIEWSKDWLESKYYESTSEIPNKWIPLKTRPMTDEERTFYRDLAEYGAEMFDCPLPDDGQEVLVTTRYDEVKTETFYRDEGCYFETYCDEDDVKAWMPLPEPYKAESEDTDADSD